MTRDVVRLLMYTGMRGGGVVANAHFTPVTICILKQQPNNQMNITQLQTMILRFVLEVSMNLPLHVST